MISFRMFKVGLMKKVHLSKYLKEVREFAGRVPELAACLTSWGIARRLV